jgi:hypothetical protein
MAMAAVGGEGKEETAADADCEAPARPYCAATGQWAATCQEEEEE